MAKKRKGASTVIQIIDKEADKRRNSKDPAQKPNHNHSSKPSCFSTMATKVRSVKSKASFKLLSRHGKMLRRLIIFIFVVSLTALTVVFSILKAPSGRDWVRKKYFDKYWVVFE